MVRDRDQQIPPPDRRSLSVLVFPAVVRADLAAVLPGRDRQDAGASQREHARRADHRPRRHIRVRDVAGNAADLSVRPHHQPHRRRIGRAAVPAPDGAADGLFPGPAGRRFRRPRSRTGEYPQLPDRFGADARHRRALHRRVPGGDVPVFAVSDLGRDGEPAVLYRGLRRHDAAVPGAARRKIQARRREPGVSGRERGRDRNAEGDGGRAAGAAPLGRAARRLCQRELSRSQPRQCRQPGYPVHQQDGDGGAFCSSAPSS